MTLDFCFGTLTGRRGDCLPSGKFCMFSFSFKINFFEKLFQKSCHQSVKQFGS